VDTVEWGSGEPARRRLPSLRYSIPLAGALALAGLGFALLLAAEFQPWATVQVPPSAASVVRPEGSLLSNGTGLGLDRLSGTDTISYHLAALALLGAVGFGLASPPSRRRLAMGAVGGLAAGQALTIIAIARSAQRFFTNFTGYDLPLADAPKTVTGPGVYLAAAAVLLLAASQVAAAIPRGREPAPAVPAAAGPEPAPPDPAGDDPANWQPQVAPAQRGDGQRGDGQPGSEREVTVAAAEPIDEHFFAHPDRG
jgi:hypothetical protein